MQFPRYELVVPREPMPPRRPERARPRRRARVPMRMRGSRPSVRLDVQEYLRLEFAVDDRR